MKQPPMSKRPSEFYATVSLVDCTAWLKIHTKNVYRFKKL